MYYLDLSKSWSLWKLVEHLLSSLYASGLRVIIDQGTNTIKKARICELPGVSTQELSCWNWHLFMFFWLAQLIPGGLTTPSFFLFPEKYKVNKNQDEVKDIDCPNSSITLWFFTVGKSSRFCETTVKARMNSTFTDKNIKEIHSMAHYSGKFSQKCNKFSEANFLPLNY